ncbi:MAG TPA: monovalent cation:proton antiporter-2 (CPA2) family protein [Polyangiaceae bacterium]|nr:monovalent cation:proton antiporter-2 (CPA2) family protein [Polyangiaceae bacterium]
MSTEHAGSDLAPLVVLLAAGVVAVALFKRLGLGSVLGYLAAGLAIGPFGLGLFSDPGSILHVAELGIVMFLFVIGLEMQPSRLWSLRRQIFGLGAAQVAACGLLLTGGLVLYGLGPAVAFVGAMGFVLSSTAIVAQILEERGETLQPRGQRIVSILLLEDLAIVPLLAVVAFLAPGASEASTSRWAGIGIGLGVLAGLIAAGRWLLNPMFRVLAAANAREVMTAAALLVVLGSAWLMQLGGLSMALGAFLAGVLLSESSFRHQLEADIEPFRSILLGLFFLGVGMSLDLSLVLRDFTLIAVGVAFFMLVKAGGIYAVARLTRAPRDEAILRSALLAQGGEFAFVLYSAARAEHLIDADVQATLSAIVILSMALTPLAVAALRFLPQPESDFDGIERASDLHGNVLLIGFGRFGQVVSQGLLARGADVSIIDTDVEMIRAAADFGFKVYYGDGTRLDVLHACNAGEAQAILVCVEKREATDKIVEVLKAEFPLARVLVRSFDRQHALSLVNHGVQFQIRETFESALRFGEEALLTLGAGPEEVAEISLDVRRRDAERFQLELAGGSGAGKALMRGNIAKPTPFTAPSRESRSLSQETALVTAEEPQAG